MRDPRPDFIVIGPARTGTTWLKEWLCCHPQVFILHGEPNFFSGWTEMTTEEYLRQFDLEHGAFKTSKNGFPKDLSPGVQKFGEKSPSYFTMPDEAIERCATLLPDVKLICTIRNPIDRAHSHIRLLKPAQRDWVEEVARNGGKCRPLKEVIGHGRYREHLLRWAWYFAPEQILLVDFARVISEPHALYAEIIEFLGLAPAPAPLSLHRVGRPKTGETMSPELEAYLAAAYAQDDWSIEGLEALIRAASPASAFSDV